MMHLRTLSSRPLPSRFETGLATTLFVVALAFNAWGATVGWQNKNLPGVEFRQTQTALTSYFIQRENDFGLAYPTPVLGKPWSIPMEFPLYQWTVVGLSNTTGLELTQAGRMVSLGCFYLTLPAIFLLLGLTGLTRNGRMIVLGLLLTCPLYIFYARAFLIETMALMFSAWFLLAFIRAIERRSVRWLICANVCGCAAGLVKVTTFMLFLLPAGLLAAIWLWRARRRGWVVLAGWVAAATALPFCATLVWIRFADATKRLNPNAEFLQSENLIGFNFGTMADRFSSETLGRHWQHIAELMVWPPVLALGVVLGLTVSRRWWRPMLICLGSYLAVLALFPILYALHDYYSVANAVFLLTALGFAVAGLIESRLPRVVVVLVVLGVFVGQGMLYVHGLYADQRGVSDGGSGLTLALHDITGPDDVLVIAGDDWSSITPYYARRRALMIRRGMQDKPHYLDAAVASLAGERVGAVVLQGKLREHHQLIDRLLAAFELDPRAVFSWHDSTVYVPVESRIRIIRQIKGASFDGVTLAADAVLPAAGALGGEWRLLDDLSSEERARFAAMSPQPVGFYASFGSGLDWRDGEPWFGAHPTTRLRFRLPAGKHRLRTKVLIAEAAYQGVFSADDPPTDGVMLQLSAREGGATPRIIYERLLDPARVEGDRFEQTIEIPFTLARETEVDLLFGPGPQGRDIRDWIQMGRLKID